MKKNILIIGASRCGKTTLSRKFNEKYGYSVVNLDDIVSGFEKAFPELGIKHNYKDVKVATKFASFLIQYLKKLSEGPNFYSGTKCVVEGVFIDFEKVIPTIDKDKYHIIGLTYNFITKEELYNNIKAYDTEDDWTYYCDDEELKGNVDYFIKSNEYFNNKFKEYGIETYDVSKDRDEVLNNILDMYI